MLGSVHEGEERGATEREERGSYTCSVDALYRASQSTGQVFFVHSPNFSLLQRVTFAKEKEVKFLSLFNDTFTDESAGCIKSGSSKPAFHEVQPLLREGLGAAEAASWLPSCDMPCSSFLLLS